MTECTDLVIERGYTWFTYGRDAQSRIHCAFFTGCRVSSYDTSRTRHQLYIIIDHGWKVYNNFCVSASDQDVMQTNWANGDASIDACKAICFSMSDCSAIEWYESGWNGSHCKLVLDSTRATQGSSGARRQDAECHVKPIVDNQGLYSFTTKVSGSCQSIMTEQQCKKFAGLNLEVKSFSHYKSSSAPRGCYIWTGSNAYQHQVYYHPTGSAQCTSSRQCICADNTQQWSSCDNYCVSDTNEELRLWKYPLGDDSITKCQNECDGWGKSCSAIEWYESGWGGSKCKLIFAFGGGGVPATKCSSGSRRQDAKCYFKPKNLSENVQPIEFATAPYVTVDNGICPTSYIPLRSLEECKSITGMTISNRVVTAFARQGCYSHWTPPGTCFVYLRQNTLHYSYYTNEDCKVINPAYHNHQLVCKRSMIYRVSNNVHTGWRPAVTDVHVYSDSTCTTEIDATFKGSSGAYSGATDGSKAFDGSDATSWRPQCHPCAIGEAWLSFSVSVEIKCVEAFYLGEGSGGRATWNGGIKVEKQNSDGTWTTEMKSTNGNSAFKSEGSGFPTTGRRLLKPLLKEAEQ